MTELKLYIKVIVLTGERNGFAEIKHSHRGKKQKMRKNRIKSVVFNIDKGMHIKINKGGTNEYKQVYKQNTADYIKTYPAQNICTDD